MTERCHLTLLISKTAQNKTGIWKNRGRISAYLLKEDQLHKNAFG